MPSELKAAAERLRYTAQALRRELGGGAVYWSDIPGRTAIRDRAEICEMIADALDPEEDGGY